MDTLLEFGPNVLVFAVLFGLAIGSVLARKRWQTKGTAFVVVGSVLAFDAYLLPSVSSSLSAQILLGPVILVGVSTLPVWWRLTERNTLLLSVGTSLIATLCTPLVLWRLMCAGETVCY